MADILGLNSVGVGSLINNRIAETNRNIEARNALNLDRYKSQKQDLVNNVNGAKEVLATDQEEDRGKEGAETITMANDLKHVDNLGVRDLLSKSETGQKVLGAVDSAGEKLNQAKSLSNSLIPQGDKLPAGELPNLNFFADKVADVRPGEDNINSVVSFGRHNFGVVGDPISGPSTMAGGVNRGLLQETLGNIGGTSNAERAQYFTARAQSRLGSLGPDTNLYNPIEARQALKAGGSDTPVFASGKTAQATLPEGASADVLGAGSKLSNVKSAVPGTIARGLQGLNVLGGAVDAGEDIVKGGISGDNTASKVSNVAGTISGGLEAAGLAMDATGIGAPLGALVGGLGAAAGAVGLVSGVIGDLKDEGKDKSQLNTAISSARTGPSKPQQQSTIGQTSYSLAGTYAGKADNNNRIQGTGAF
jgi:hypothetical protein